MKLLIELIITLCQVFKAIVCAIFYAFFSAKRKSVSGEVVLITGSGSGLGRLMCIEFAKRGATIIAWDISHEANKETKDHIVKKGGTIYAYKCDVSDRESVFKTAEAVKRDVGRVDILVNNAGIVTGEEFIDLSVEQIEKTVAVNLLGNLWTVKAFLPDMTSRNHGHVVTIASVAGLIGCKGLSDYCASKFGAVGFAESLEYELRAGGYDDVHTTTVCPYFINTGMFDGCLPRFPMITPVLQPQETIDRIMKAILTNQKVVCIPRSMYIFSLLKHILPVDATFALNKFFGSTDFMTTFKGRHQKRT